MPLLVRILSRGHVRVLSGPYTVGRYGIVLNTIGLIFLLFASITFNFSTLNPVDQNNMNYTSAAIGVIGLISAITWFTTGRKNLTRPESGIIITNVEATVDIGREGSGGEDLFEKTR